jgi:hypothetical protein
MGRLVILSAAQYFVVCFWEVLTEQLLSSIDLTRRHIALPPGGSSS